MLFLLSNSVLLVALVSSFSSSPRTIPQRGHPCCDSSGSFYSMQQNQDWRNPSSFCSIRGGVSLSALPKREWTKQKPFQVNASTTFGFLSGGKDSQQGTGSTSIVENRQDEESLLLEQYELEMQIQLQQKQDFEAYVQSRAFVEDMKESNHLHHQQQQQQQHLAGGGSLDASSKNESMFGFNAVWQARFLLLASAALYGTNFTFVKVLNENVPVQLGTAMRFLLAAAVTAPWLFRKAPVPVHESSSQAKGNQDMETSNSNIHGNTSQMNVKAQSNHNNKYGVLLGGMEVGTWNAIGYLAQAIGLETTHASTSAFICSLAVVVVPILDFLAGKKLLRREMIGAILAVTGVAFLEFDGVEQSLNVGSGNGMWLSSGDLYSLVQPLAFGLGFWRMEHYMRKFPTEPMKLTAAQLSTISILSLAALVFTSGIDMHVRNVSFVMDWLKDPVVAGSLLWTGLVTTALTVAMETIALKTLSAAETTMLFSTEPIFGGICASFVLGEQFGVGGLIGSAMVLGGCLYSNLDLGRGEKKRK